ncbi:MAG TPA: RNA 3'-terminal phosphate cyclase [Phycisphaerales bacterium]|nr:RNA 3'-terminal phosphate cyclase [Phycisphaerales bacterium]
MIHIDGSQGEGGGQILRSSLALSMATGKPFRIANIRAGRDKPGLKRQHLTCVRAAASICAAEVTGDEVGSMDVTFTPSAVTPGAYHFPIGTAGSTTMVLQAILPPLQRADYPSRITVEGGTYNKAAPPFDFFARVLVPLLNQLGPTITAHLERPGFFPAGGGRLVVEVQPTATPRPLALLERGRATTHAARAIISKLPASIGDRELTVVGERLGLPEDQLRIHEVRDALCPGNALCIELGYEHVTELFSSVGELGRSAESVAREAADQAREYIASKAPVGPHLADQLMVPLALLAGGEYMTGRLTEHSTTNIRTIAAFGGEVVARPDGRVRVFAMR